MEILLENIPNDLSSAARLLQFEELTHVGLNFCFDTGHANMGKGVENEFHLMKPRIRSTHVHDNNGKDDMHLLPVLGEGGTIDWKNTMELLRSGGDQYPLMLELKDHGDVPHPLEIALEISTGWKTSKHDSANLVFPKLPNTSARPSRSPAGCTTCAGPARSRFRFSATVPASCSAWP